MAPEEELRSGKEQRTNTLLQMLKELIGNLSKGDGGNVQLLLLDETEQQVERAFEDR